ncbi:RNA polymerase sigma factor [Faecalispora anaeroviscerum]|uniref:RNA polymerase sigma factor n=1 Tax=Faecalispora anaeroviscerum TaxID=2991836 RepID=UPI0024BB80BB|nr:sigma-70 family RNA polymerase sigma factor [Faecalispora anaeroviscerum]
MRKKRLSLDQFTESLAGIQEYRRQGESADAEYHRMLHTLNRAMEGELTDRQRQCVQLCFFEGLTARQAAQELCIHESTVSRHLKKARQRLERVLRYSFNRLE